MSDPNLKEWIPDFYSTALHTIADSVQNECVKLPLRVFAVNIQNYLSMPFIVGRIFYQGWLAGLADRIVRAEILVDDPERYGTPEERRKSPPVGSRSQ